MVLKYGIDTEILLYMSHIKTIIKHGRVEYLKKNKVLNVEELVLKFYYAE